jgi:Cd2+/Zn2+-exporting ATPase
VAGQGISVEFDGHKISAGNETLMKNLQINYISCDEVGTKIYIAKDKDYLGCIVIADQIRDDSVDTVRLLKKENIVKTVMLTGDDGSIAEDIAKQIGLDEYHANLLPDQKVSWFEQISKNNTTGQTAFVGDGINDAPVLARADVGIAMGGLGADAAIEAADIVLMTDEPSKLVDAFQIAHKTRQIVIQNIVFAIAIKILFLGLGALGLIGLWAAVFADVGVMVLAVFNAMRMLNHQALPK